MGTDKSRYLYGDKKQLRLAVVLTVVTSIILIAACVFISGFFIEKQTQNATAYLQEVATQNGNIIDGRMEGDLSILRAVAAFIGEYPNMDEQQLLDVLSDINDNNSFKRMGFVDLTGKATIVELNGKVYTNLYFLDQEYVQVPLSGKEFVAQMTKDGLGDDWVNTCSVPVWDRNGSIIGALVGINRADRLTAVADASQFNNRGFSMIISSDGVLVTRSEHKNADPDLTNIFSLKFISKQDKTELTENLVSRQSGSFEYISYNGEKFYAGYVPISINDWFVVSVVPADAVNQYFTETVLLSVICVLFICFLCISLMLRNYSSIRNNRKEMEQLAYFDSLTGCMNRECFELSFRDFVKRDDGFALALLDVRNTKIINNLFGYTIGNDFLRHIASVVKAHLTQEELFFRDAADRFGLLLKETAPLVIHTRLEEILREISAFSPRIGENYKFTCNCGVMLLKERHDRHNLNEQIDKLYIALNEAKKSDTGNTIVFYNENFLEAEKRRNYIESNMEKALENKEFLIYLQPKIDLHTGRVESAEALVRWNTEKYGLLPPDEFIPLFEKNGFITKLDLHVLERVCAQQRKELDSGNHPIPIGVNHSRILFYHAGYVASVKRVLEKYRMPPHLIILEITETAAMSDERLFRRIMTELQELGLHISLDDFGTDYSSLNILRDMPFDRLKLDKSFLTKSGDISRQTKIIDSVISLTKELGITTVAEGIETKQQAEYLKALGCDIGQGFFFSKPVPYNEFLLFMKANQTKTEMNYK